LLSAVRVRYLLLALSGAGARQEIKQRLALTGVTASEIDDQAKQVYAVAMARTLGLYDEAAGRIREGTNIT